MAKLALQSQWEPRTSRTQSCMSSHQAGGCESARTQQVGSPSAGKKAIASLANPPIWLR